MTKTKLLGAAAGALLSTTFAASATPVELGFIDFTAENAPLSGSIGSIDWSVSALGGAITQGNGIPPGAASGLDGLSGRGFAGAEDGLGIGAGDDEVTFPGEALTISFTKDGSAVDVSLTSAYFLDLFTTSQSESANISVGLAAVLPADSVTFATNADFGYGEFSGALIGSSFTFFAGPGLDDKTGDFALAGIVVSAVPLPAGMLLMGTALGGLGLMRRRKKA